jgi:hypothetical protein
VEERPPRLLGHRAENDGASLSHHASLLPCDGGEGGAEERLVIEIEAHHRRHQGVGHVRCVEPPPEAHLEDRHLHPGGSEVPEGSGGQRLEIRRKAGDRRRAHEGFGRVTHGRHRDGEITARDRPASYRDPLVHPHEVGRGVEAAPESRSPEGSVEGGGDRAFAVRARDEQGGEGPLGMAESAYECPRRVEAELDAELGALLEVGQGSLGREHGAWILTGMARTKRA